MRAKFEVQTVTKSTGQEVVRLTPVISGSEENKSFAKFTPGGSLELYVNNPDAYGFFEPGKAFYLDITPAN